METKRGQDLQWASVSEKSRDVKRIVTSPLGKIENGCMIVVLRPTKVRYGWESDSRDTRQGGMQSLPWGVDGGFGKKIKNERYEFRESGVVKRC